MVSKVKCKRQETLTSCPQKHCQKYFYFISFFHCQQKWCLADKKRSNNNVRQNWITTLTNLMTDLITKSIGNLILLILFFFIKKRDLYAVKQVAWPAKNIVFIQKYFNILHKICKFFVVHFNSNHQYWISRAFPDDMAHRWESQIWIMFRIISFSS